MLIRPFQIKLSLLCVSFMPCWSSYILLQNSTTNYSYIRHLLISITITALLGEVLRNYPAYTYMIKILTLFKTFFSNFALCHISIECNTWEYLSAKINGITKHVKYQTETLQRILVTAVDESVVTSTRFTLSFRCLIALSIPSRSILGDLLWTSLCQRFHFL